MCKFFAKCQKALISCAYNKQFWLPILLFVTKQVFLFQKHIRVCACKYQFVFSIIQIVKSGKQSIWHIQQMRKSFN